MLSRCWPSQYSNIFYVIAQYNNIRQLHRHTTSEVWVFIRESLNIGFSQCHTIAETVVLDVCWSTEKSVSVEWPQHVLFFSHTKHAEYWNLSVCQLVKNQQQFLFSYFWKKSAVQVTFEILNKVHFLHILCFEVAVIFHPLISSLRFFKDTFVPHPKMPLLSSASLKSSWVILICTSSNSSVSSEVFSSIFSPSLGSRLRLLSESRSYHAHTLTS